MSKIQAGSNVVRVKATGQLGTSELLRPEQTQWPELRHGNTSGQCEACGLPLHIFGGGYEMPPLRGRYCSSTVHRVRVVRTI
jgi:hypothetical protein